LQLGQIAGDHEEIAVVWSGGHLQGVASDVRGLFLRGGGGLVNVNQSLAPQLIDTIANWAAQNACFHGACREVERLAIGLGIGRIAQNGTQFGLPARFARQVRRGRTSRSGRGGWRNGWSFRLSPFPSSNGRAGFRE